jgi:hypothetical protein
MSNHAFHTRRVTESLAAIERYIQSSVDIAEAVAASKTLAFKLRDTRLEAFAPELASVVFDNGTNAIALETGARDVAITVSGRDLDRVTKVTLTRGGHVFTGAVADPGSLDFTAKVTGELVADGYGDYDAQVFEGKNKSAVLKCACAIVEPAAVSADIQLGAVYQVRANATSGGSTSFEIGVTVLKGVPTQFHITNLQGQDVGLHAEYVSETVEDSLRVITLKITSVGGPRATYANHAGPMLLVASNTQSSDRLLLRLSTGNVPSAS